MPIGDAKHESIYQELVNILGPDNVEDDPAVMEAVYRDGFIPAAFAPARPEYIVLPGSTEDIQQIMRLANRYQFPWSITSTGLNMMSCNAVPGYPYWGYIDPKRMNQLITIDVDNMYYIAEPYVTIAQVQAEAMKHGLYCGVPGASCQTSALAGNLYEGIRWTCWRVGVGRDILGMEWVLPSGEILRTGTLALPHGDWSWGEGPGPDPRGLLRGHTGHLGSLGVVTKVAAKLYRWTGPPVYQTSGVQPEKTVDIPPEMISSYFIHFPTLKDSIDAIAEMGKAEIAGLVMKFCPWDFVCWVAKSFEEFWQLWYDPFWEDMRENRHMVWVQLWQYTSDKQMQYEDRVLKQIMTEHGGEMVPDEVHQYLDAGLTPNAVRDTHRNRFTRIGVVMVGATMDSMYDVLRSAELDFTLKDKFTPPLGVMGNSIKFWPFDFGHTAWTEVDTIGEKDSPEHHDLFLNQWLPDMVKLNLTNQSVPTVFLGFLSTRSVGRAHHNARDIFHGIKKALDPNNVAQPTRILDIKTLEEAEVKQI